MLDRLTGNLDVLSYNAVACPKSKVLLGTLEQLLSLEFRVSDEITKFADMTAAETESQYFDVEKLKAWRKRSVDRFVGSVPRGRLAQRVEADFLDMTFSTRQSSGIPQRGVAEDSGRLLVQEKAGPAVPQLKLLQVVNDRERFNRLPPEVLKSNAAPATDDDKHPLIVPPLRIGMHADHQTLLAKEKARAQEPATLEQQFDTEVDRWSIDENVQRWSKYEATGIWMSRDRPRGH